MPNFNLKCIHPLSLVPIKMNDIILIIYPGTGLECLFAVNQIGYNGMIIASDTSFNNLKKIQKMCYKYDNIYLILQNINCLPFFNNSFNLILYYANKNNIFEKRKIINQVYEKIKKNGYFIISDVVTKIDFNEKIINEIINTDDIISLDNYISMLEAVKFKNIKINARLSLSDNLISSLMPSNTIEKKEQEWHSKRKDIYKNIEICFITAIK